MSTTTTTRNTHSTTFASPFALAPQRKTMSITQTYFLAHKARAKLSSQAARPDHNLRLLVGHANLLDTLMLELADAEREQESWFNQSVQQSSAPSPSPSYAADKTDRHVQWADTIVEEPEEDWQAEDADNDAESDMSSDSFSDSDDDIYEEDEEEEEEEDSEVSASSLDEDDLMADAAPLRRVDSKVEEIEVEPETEAEDDAEFDDEAHDAHLSLTRSASHSSASAASLHMSSPPDLVIEEDSDDLLSDDDASMPPSPPALSLQSFSPKTASKPSTIPTSPQQQDQEEHDGFHDSSAHYFVPPRNPARLIPALAVY